MKVIQVVLKDNNKNLPFFIILQNIVIEQKEILQMKDFLVQDLKQFIQVIKHQLKIQNMKNN